MSHLLDEIVRAHKQGRPRGITSICSAHPWVLKTVMQTDSPLLIESTCNQVNQYGGYSGMKPADFASFVHSLAAENHIPEERLILGGDHLGPYVWRKEPAASAMRKSVRLVRDCVKAGYTKIHLDTSMRLGDDDPENPLDLELIARRAAQLAKAAEGACANLEEKPRYVIGSEVPLPGGATRHEDGVQVTPVESVRRTLEVTRAAFLKADLAAALERLVALVVQPGVEFGTDFVLEYDPAAARGLSRYAETASLVYEAHSTDYQTRQHLRAMVRDHFAILKVGPALTFAFRQAVFALSRIEAELFPLEQRSALVETLDKAMLRKPEFWRDHYHGSPAEQAEARLYSRSDRLRYYWPDPQVQAALAHLLANLESVTIPLSLISQFASFAYEQVYSGLLPNRSASLIEASIRTVLEDYRYACAPAD
jgi:D-tagatose-1,6-bisphosphate aldolase subunit GatZ/KbaZ